MSRVHKDIVLLATAHLWSRQSTCTRNQVGAVIATPEYVGIGTGYNGTPSGTAHCSTDLATPCTSCEHAERNAIYFAARRGVRVRGCTMYTTMAPCLECARAIIQSGIVRVVYERTYRKHDGPELLRSVGIKAEQKWAYGALYAYIPFEDQGPGQ